jgi:ubiquinone biosynthesis protein
VDTTVIADVVIVVVFRVLAAIAIAVIATVISLRFLGIRRGWGTALLAGLIGWGGAGALALALNHWDWGADGLAIHVFAIAVPATMATAVALDLLARPGSLAIGERAGLVTAPRPFRAIRRRVEVLRRYRELVRLARREGFGPRSGSGATTGSDDGPADLGIRLRRVLEEAGGVYIKLGQIAATRVDLLPPEVCAELAGLQNQVTPEPMESIRDVLETELGGDVDTVFAEFDWTPLGAASIGQTYRARLRSGEGVVVKVQRPDVQEVIERDLAALALIADVAQRRTAFGQGIRSGEVLGQFAQSLRAELDFRREVDAMTEMAVALRDHSNVRIPRVHKQLCTRRLIVQEHFDGFTVADSARLAQAAIDRSALGDELLRAMLDQVLRIGFFHADPHPGNIFVFDDGTLGLIDFGAVGRLDPIQQAAVVDMLAGLMRRDVSLLRDGIERVADITEVVSPERLERALARLMAENIRATGALEPTVLQDLVRMLAEFGIRLPGDLVILSRALVTLDGTLRVISPTASIVTEASRMVTASEDPVIDREAMIRDELLAALPHLRHLPDRIDRILTLTSRGDLRIRHVVDEDGQRVLRTLVNRALLLAIGAVLVLAATLMLVAADSGPAVADGTGLFDVFGYGGLLAGTVLLLRVAAGVARDGTT